MNKIFTFPDTIEEVIEPIEDLKVEGTWKDPPCNVRRFRIVTLYIIVTAVSGTVPTLDVTLEARYLPHPHSVWMPIYTFPQITTVGNYRHTLEIVETHIRYSLTVGGTTPSFRISRGFVLKS